MCILWCRSICSNHKKFLPFLHSKVIDNETSQCCSHGYYESQRPQVEGSQYKLVSSTHTFRKQHLIRLACCNAIPSQQLLELPMMLSTIIKTIGPFYKYVTFTNNKIKHPTSYTYKFSHQCADNFRYITLLLAPPLSHHSK